MRSSSDNKTIPIDSQLEKLSILKMHESTVATLSRTERYFLDIFIKEGTAVIIPDEVNH